MIPFHKERLKFIEEELQIKNKQRKEDQINPIPSYNDKIGRSNGDYDPKPSRDEIEFL